MNNTTIKLRQGTKPYGLEVKTWGVRTPEVVNIGEYQLSMKDFLRAARYVLTNTDLEPDDPRLQFLKYVKSMKIVDGYNPGGKQLKASVPPIPSSE